MVRMTTRGTGTRPPRLGGQPRRGLDAVHHRHAHVHQHDVGVLVMAHLQRLGAVGRGPDDGEVGLGVEQHGEPGPHDLLVVDHDDAHRPVGVHQVTVSGHVRLPAGWPRP